MTIGIVVAGAGAGLAAFQALRAVERVARGAIGGFVSFVALTENGPIRALTQRGGTATLFTDGETTGVVPPPPIARAKAAALMSSGPDRPEPLDQFVAVRPGVGLVSGHRVPNRPGVDGRSLLQATLEAMAAGADAEAAVRAQLARNPDADAGLIALDAKGGLFAGNSALVARRTDLGHARWVDAETGAAVAVLHNSIHPVRGLAELAAGVALDAMNPGDRVDRRVRLAAGVKLRQGPREALLIDSDDRVVALAVVRPELLSGRHAGGVLGFRPEVRCGDRVVGEAVVLPSLTVAAGRVATVSGALEAWVGVRQPGPVRG